MAHLNERNRIVILMMIGYGDRRRSYAQVANLFNENHPDRIPISKSTVLKTFQRFQETGSVKDREKVGRLSSVTNEDDSLNVMLNVTETPTTSIRQLALNHNMSRGSITKIMKRENYRQFKIHLLQELSGDDFNRRIVFCETMMNKFEQDDDFVNRVLFSDESTFCLSGQVNRHNCRYWSDTNPYWMEQLHTQYPQKLNVWCGIIGHHIVGPFFINGNLTSPRYLELLQQRVIPRLRQIFPNYENQHLVAETIWFQQDEHRLILDSKYGNT